MGVHDSGHLPSATSTARRTAKSSTRFWRQCGIPRPAGQTIFTTEEALEAAHQLEYPVLVRPSYVLGGQGMEIARSDEDIIEYHEDHQPSHMEIREHPILVDKYVDGSARCEVDAMCDGEDILDARYHGAFGARGRALRRLDFGLSCADAAA